MSLSLALAGLAIEAVCGYPRWLYRAVGHPVSWIGRLIAWCDRAWNSPEQSFSRRRIAGVGALVIVLGITGATSVALTQAIGYVAPHSFGLILLGLLASTFIAQRSLDEHVRAVADALDGGTLDDARRAVGQIVGRDTGSLDQHAISRAAIESLSENFSDGVVAPVLWLAVGGLPGIAIYKAINTADSMIGHKTERHLAFGWAAARLDDVVNLPASRLSAVWIATAAALLPDVSGRRALVAAWRDARKHRSPNAGWPEAAMAGALDLKLAGPRVYGGEVVDDHWMGLGRSAAEASDIRRALRVYRVACIVQAGALALLAIALT